MSADAKGTTPEASGTAAPAEAAPSVRMLWPIAVLAVGGAAIIGGAMWGVKTTPKAEIKSPLSHIEELRAAGDFAAALEELNGKALAYVNIPETDESEIREFFLLRARTLYQAQAAAGADRPENNEAIVSDYEAAEKRGATLDPTDTVRIAEGYLATKRLESALERVRSLPKNEGERRRQLLKLIVQRGIAERGTGGLSASRVLELLIGLSKEPDLKAEDAAWALARQAELLIGIGMPGDAAARLMREMQLLRGISPAGMGELYFLLGKAQYESGDRKEAARQLERAMELLGPLDPMQAPARLMTARMLQSTGQVEAARDQYRDILRLFPATPEYLPSLHGLGAVLATLGEEDESLGVYSELVERLTQRGAGIGSTTIDGLQVSDVADALMARHDDQAGSDHTREAMRYGLMAESLYEADKVPASVLLALGSTSRRIANELMGRGGAEAQEEPEGAKHEIDRATLEAARQHYLSAAKYFQRHSQATVITDSAGSARSHWDAADSYDSAGETEQAIREFTYYTQSASDDDPRRPEAKFRLAQAFHGLGDLKTAASLYAELIDAGRASGVDSAERGPNGVLLWGDRSIVPLARCYAMDSDEANDAEAERLLQGVLSGRDLAPESPEFRDALVELGTLYYRRERYADAIARLTELLERYPKDRDVTTARYKLADSLRLSSDQIDRELADAIPQSQRLELEKLRRSRRREAVRLYGLVRAALESKQPDQQTDIERTIARNSVFYQGDCAYDSGDFESAISYYDDAKQRYASEPASLVAMVQIVNAYVQRGEWAKAATANQRAVQHLEKFPESVWSQPNLPMEKKHWARWLDARALLDHREQAAVNRE